MYIVPLEEMIEDLVCENDSSICLTEFLAYSPNPEDLLFALKLKGIVPPRIQKPELLFFDVLYFDNDGYGWPVFHDPHYAAEG